jgi:dipeptidyl-peptidase-4
VDAVTGSAEPLVTTSQIESALVEAGVPAIEASRTTGRRSSRFTPKRDALLLTVRSDLFVYTIATRRATRLTSAPGDRAEATFSPDGRAVAFIKDNDLHVASAAGERALTADGSAEILNGKLDCVFPAAAEATIARSGGPFDAHRHTTRRAARARTP